LIGRSELSWLKILDDFEKNDLKPFYQPIKYDNSVKIPPTNVYIPGFVITGAIEATRGCPYRCEFCPETIVPESSQFYARPVEEVIAEIKSIPQKTLMFYDNSLTINPDYTKSLFKKMKPLNKKFFCNGNSNILAVDKELIRLSKEAGCVSWLVGFESVSQKTLDEIGKTGNKVDEYFQAVKNIHDHGMAVIGSFMFGFDSDTKDVFDETLKTIKKLEIDIADFCILTPIVGTPVFNKLDKDGRILTKDWSKYDMKNVVFEPKNMTPEELLQGVKRMYTNFYSTSYTVKRIVKSLRLGLYPFFLVLARNMVANMHSKLLLSSRYSK
jgi:radical SAM superfamily enzyme YgiQ (UPF0313 family)